MCVWNAVFSKKVCRNLRKTEKAVQKKKYELQSIDLTQFLLSFATVIGK